MGDAGIVAGIYREGNYKVAYKFRRGDSNIVFLHGLSGLKETFDEGFSHDAVRGFGILSLDIPGFGESTVSDRDYSIEAQAEKISRVIRHLKIKDIVLVGHSYAGPICYEIFKLLPGDIQRIVLAESSIRPKKSWTTSISSHSLEEYRSIFRETLKCRYKFCRRALVDESEKNTSILVEGLERTTAEAMYYSARELVEYCYRGDLAEKLTLLGVPVKYIVGSKNKERLNIDPNLVKLREAGIKIEVVGESGHCMMLDNPHSFYRACVNW